jgi:hypothetical protein
MIMMTYNDFPPKIKNSQRLGVLECQGQIYRSSIPTTEAYIVIYTGK